MRRKSTLELVEPEEEINEASLWNGDPTTPPPQEEAVTKLNWPASFPSLKLLDGSSSIEIRQRDFLLHATQQVLDPTPRTLWGLSSIRMTLLGKERTAESPGPSRNQSPRNQVVNRPRRLSKSLDATEVAQAANAIRQRRKSRDGGDLENTKQDGEPGQKEDAGSKPQLKRTTSQILRRALSDGGAETDVSEDTKLDAWFESDRMVQKRRVVNQYLECCARVSRLPCLKNQLQFFLHKPRLQRLDMSGCAITSADIDAFFSALTGQGCGLNPEKSIGFVSVCPDRSQCGIRLIDVSSNSLGPDGMRKLARIVLDNDFFNMDPPAESAGATTPGGSAVQASELTGVANLLGGAPSEEDMRLQRNDPMASGVAGSTGVARALTELDVSQNGLTSAGARALQELLISPRCTIVKLSAGSNLFQDVGCCAVINSLISENHTLRFLDLSENNAAISTGTAVGIMLKVNTTLEELNLGYNHIRAIGAKAVCAGLMRNTTLTELKLQWNGFGDEDALNTLSRAIPIGGLTSLNLAHNRITLKGASILAQGIEKATNLTELNLDGNFLGQVGTRMILRAAAEASSQGGEFAGSETASISAVTNPVYGYRDKFSNPILGALPTSTHGHAEICKSAFDPCETAGEYELDMKDGYSRSILKKLIQAQQNGRGSFAQIRVNGIALAANAKLEIIEYAEDWKNVEISDTGSIDELDWSIFAQLSPTRFVRLPIVETLSENGDLVPLSQSWAAALGCEEKSLSGLLRFSYIDLRKRSTLGDCLPEHMFAKLHDAFCAAELDADDCIEVVNTVLASDVFISVKQMEELLNELSDDDANTSARKAALSKIRIMFITRCFHKVAEAGRNKEFLALLSGIERTAAESMLGQVSLEFTPSNPTGFHKLDMSDPAQREICFRLIEMYNEMEPRLRQIKDFYNSGRSGGRREDEHTDGDLERIWRHGKLDGQKFGPHSKVPSRGTLQVDFVQITKPNPADKHAFAHNPVMNDIQFEKFLSSAREAGPDQKSKVMVIRKQSDLGLFTCRQLVTMLAAFTDLEMRVEICVIGFARTVDWHGYKNVIMRLSSPEMKMLQHRIGLVNLFDDIMAVDFYELDLSNRAQRFIMQELVHLAAVEPGNNMIDVTMNGVDFNVPKSWLKEVGRSGEITLYYCREQRVIERIFEKGAWEGRPSPYHLREDEKPFGSSAWSTFTPQWLKKYCKENPEGGPVPCSQPAGDAWVMPYKLRRVKAHMAEKFSQARDMFDAMDQDGGGSLDRKEMAMGLYKLGVWLHPKELQALLEALDEDGGGTIDFDEFEAFWDAFTFD